MRRFSVCLRSIVALLCVLLMSSSAQPPGMLVASALLGYGLWAGYTLASRVFGWPSGKELLHQWVDVAWSAVMLLLMPPVHHSLLAITLVLVLVLVQPVLTIGIGYGLRRRVLLMLVLLAALAAAYAAAHPFVQAADGGITQGLPAMALLALAPAAALLLQPLSRRRQRLALVGDIDAPLDPRRGLEIVAARLVDQLCRGAGTQVVGLILPSASGAPALLGSADEASYRSSAAMHQRIEALLADTPEQSLTYSRQRHGRLPGVLQVQGDAAAPAAPAALVQSMDALAELLNVRTLVVVPLTRYQRRHGHLVVGLSGSGQRRRDVASLAQAMPEFLRVIEQAALVDKLQAESEAHESVRIGRDLHDSAIQPYLGLKYAVEAAALRIPPNNPARAEVDALAVLVNSEVAALRELISDLRCGHGPGENALVPAVLRQTRRFALLFGIDVVVDCPDTLLTTRTLADALFHMVNEALNNIRKHSGARRVWLAMSVEDGSLRLSVRDDAGSLLGRRAAPFRPRSLCERAAELGGTLDITYADGLNTELLIQIPL